MGRTREEQEALAAVAERDLDDPEAWGDPVEADPPRRRLGSVISVRLDPDLHEALAREAERRGVGYTTLARQLIASSLAATTRRVTVEFEMRADGTISDVRAGRSVA